MTITEAISQSSSGIALLVKRSPDRIVLAMHTSSGIRIVRSFTDPTVVRKLRDEEERMTNWEPVEMELSA